MELGLLQDSIRPTGSTVTHGCQYVATYSRIDEVKEGRASWFENIQTLTIKDANTVLINVFTYCPTQQ